MQEGGVAQLAELVVVLGVDAAHGLHHLAAELHGRRQRLGVAAEDVPEVDVEERAGRRQQQVVEVAVAHAQQVRDHAVARAAAQVRVHGVGAHAVGRAGARVVAPQVALDGALAGQRLRHRGRLHVLQQAVARAGGQHLVRRQLEVEVLTVNVMTSLFRHLLFLFCVKISL